MAVMLAQALWDRHMMIALLLQPGPYNRLAHTQKKVQGMQQAKAVQRVQKLQPCFARLLLPTLLLQQALNGTTGDHLGLLHGIIDAGLGVHTVVLQEANK